MTTKTAQRALTRARSFTGTKSELAVIEAFVAAGFEPEQVEPRVNVLTFQAWRALGRTVRKGEKAVKVSTWVPMRPRNESDEDDKPPRLRPKIAALFHVSQTTRLKV